MFGKSWYSVRAEFSASQKDNVDSTGDKIPTSSRNLPSHLKKK